MSGPNNVDVFRWPTGTSARDRATVGSRAKLLHVLALCEDPQIWIAATANPWMQDHEGVTRLVIGWRQDVLDLARDHPVGTIRDLALAVTGAMSPSALTRPTFELGPGEVLYLAGQPWTPASRLAELARSRNQQVRLRVLRHPLVSPDVLEVLIGGDDDVVADLALEALRLPPERYPSLLTRLPERRAVAVARLKRFPAEDAAVDPTLPPAVRLAVISHQHLPDALLAGLARDEDRQVRLTIARRPDLSDGLLMHFAANDDRELRLAVAHRCPPASALVLLHDSDRGVLRAAAANQRLPGEDVAAAAFEAGEPRLLPAAAEREDLTTDQIRRLLRAVLAESYGRPVEVLTASQGDLLEADDIAPLLADPQGDADLAAVALRHPSCPADLVLRHITDPDPIVRYAALQTAMSRDMPVPCALLDVAEATPFQFRPTPEGMIGYEAPTGGARILIKELRERCLR